MNEKILALTIAVVMAAPLLGGSAIAADFEPALDISGCASLKDEGIKR